MTELKNKLLTFQSIQELTGGNWITPPQYPDISLKGGAFDTRALGNADIFFAWQGENSDGHQYLNQLEESHIKLIIVEKTVPGVGNKAILQVNDTMEALHGIAADLIKGFKGQIVNITGSSGKTTTKEWMKHIVNGHRNLLTNIGSFNNHIGCPITILGIEEKHDLLILEMGTSGPGELTALSAIAPADISVLLNVGHAHLGKFRGLDDIYRAKLELFKHQRNNAISLIPFGDERLKNFLPDGNWTYFGEGSPDFSWQCLKVDPESRSQDIRFETPDGSKTVTVPRLGDYVGELLAAIIAVCYHLGLNWEQIRTGIGSLPYEKGRAIFSRGINEVLILDDTYNGNPESVIAMLKLITSLQMKQTLGVVGNLAELDDDLSESGSYIIERIPDGLSHLFLGGDTGQILLPLLQDRYPGLRLSYFETIQELIDNLAKMTDADTIIGVKGSRSAHMERVVLGLKGKYTNCALNRCLKMAMCETCDQF